MKKYKLTFDFKLVDLFLLLGICLGFYMITLFIFSFIGGIFYGLSNNLNVLFPFIAIGFGIGSLGSLIFVIKYIIEGIEINSVE